MKYVKYHGHHSHTGNKQRKMQPPNKWLKGIPKSVLNFPQHLPTHLLDEYDIDNNDDKDDNDDIDDDGEDDGGDKKNNYSATGVASHHPLNKNKEIETKITSTAATSTAVESATAPNHSGGNIIKTDIPENVLSSFNSDVGGGGGGLVGGGQSNILSSSSLDNKDTTMDDISSSDTNEATAAHQISSNDKLRIITANPIIIDSKITDDSTTSTRYVVPVDDFTDSIDTERGYYEKTIINKNGVFIENIRKIVDDEYLKKTTVMGGIAGGGGGGGESTTSTTINDGTSTVATTTTADKIWPLSASSALTLSSPSSASTSSIVIGGGGGGGLSTSNRVDDYDENINRKNIALMSVPLSQHYVITSSGKIEKTDPLASDDVIEQFRDGLLNEYQRQPLLHRGDGGDGESGIRTTISGGGGSHIFGDSSGGKQNIGTSIPLITSTATTTVTTSAPVISGGVWPDDKIADDLANGATSQSTAADTNQQQQFKCIVMGKCARIFKFNLTNAIFCNFKLTLK